MDKISRNIKNNTKIDDTRKIFKIQIEFHTTSVRFTSKIEDDKRNFTKYKLIFIPHQFGVHCLINIFVKSKNDSYSLNESYLLVTLDSMIDKNLNNKLQVKNILKYFDDMKHINVEHILLTNIPKEKDDYSCGAFVYLYSYYALSKINEDLPKDKWCDKFCSITATYDIQDSEML